jgi:hypothetical protein
VQLTIFNLSFLFQAVFYMRNPTSSMALTGVMISNNDSSKSFIGLNAGGGSSATVSDMTFDGNSNVLVSI